MTDQEKAEHFARESAEFYRRKIAMRRRFAKETVRWKFDKESGCILLARLVGGAVKAECVPSDTVAQWTVEVSDADALGEMFQTGRTVRAAEHKAAFKARRDFILAAIGDQSRTASQIMEAAEAAGIEIAERTLRVYIRDMGDEGLIVGHREPGKPTIWALPL